MNLIFLVSEVVAREEAVHSIVVFMDDHIPLAFAMILLLVASSWQATLKWFCVQAL